MADGNGGGGSGWGAHIKNFLCGFDRAVVQLTFDWQLCVEKHVIIVSTLRKKSGINSAK